MTAAIDQRPWEARLPFFYGWVIVGVTFMVGLMNSGLTWVAIGVFAPPMAEDTGWSRAALFSGLVLRSYVGAALAPVIGPHFDSLHGARWLSVASGGLMAINVCTLALIQAEWQFVLLFGGVGGVVSAGQAGQLGALVPKWFVQRRGTAMAVATTGIGLAALLVAPPLAFLISVFGWRGAWVCVGVATFVLAALPAFLIRRQPEDVGLLPDNGVNYGAKARPVERSYTVSETFRTPQAWLLLAGISVVSLYTAGLPTNIPSMLEDLGQTRDTAVLGLTVYGAGSVLGRYLWAWPANRFHVRWVMIAITAYGAVMCPLILA
ncbi:MAG: MFS transporter, partial [Dehalococcoidia bacterium]|nr:MFS transporter [Dehalococcoidia bacterium]